MIHLLDYVKKTLKQDYDSEEIITKSQQFLSKDEDGDFDDTKYKHMCLNNTEFGLMITITIYDPEPTDFGYVPKENEPVEEYSLTSPDGVFSYVYNVDTPYFSELGYTFFQNKGGKIVRVG